MRLNGHMVNEIVRERGLVKRWLAIKAGMNPSVLSRCITGKQAISQEQAARLANVLGVPMVDLVIQEISQSA